MSTRALIVLAVFPVFFAPTTARSAAAQNVRALVLAKYTLDERTLDASGLEAAASATLQRVGLRVVDLDSALRAQRMLLADEVRACRVPSELSVLNADLLVALQLRCSEGKSTLLESKLYAAHCVIDSKVVATSSGDVLFSQSQSLTGHGVNAQLAVQRVLDKRVPEWLTQSSAAWLSAFTGSDAWTLDLVVSHISDRETGQGLAQRLDHLPGVTAATLVAYDHGLAKYALAGRGREQLAGLADAIDHDALLSLSVTYQTARQLQAEFDFVKAYRQRVVAMSIIPRDSALYGAAPELMRSALMSLPYLDMAHTLPLLSGPEDARALEARLRDRAKSMGVPLLLAAQLVPGTHGWVATLKLIDIRVGRTLTAASANETTSTLALAAAVRSFDERFRAAIQQAGVRQRFGFEDLAHRLATSPHLAIQSFQLPPRAERSTANATVELRNGSNTVVRAPRLSISSVGRELGVQALADLAPGATARATVPLDVAAVGADDCSLITAKVTYATDGGYDHSESVAPWCTQNARAAPAAPTTARDFTDSMVEAARKHAAGDWQEALTLYRRSDQLSSNARTLRGMGMVELDLGQHQEAARHLAGALESKTDPLTDQERAQVRHLLSRSRQSLAMR